MPTLNHRIRCVRELFGYLQECLAHHLAITQAAYAQSECGKTRLTIERLEQIAAFYGLSSADLLTKQSDELVRQLVSHPNFKAKWQLD